MGQLYSETPALWSGTPWMYEDGATRHQPADDPWGFLDYNPPAGARGLLLAILLGCIGLASYWGDATLARPLALFSQGMVALLGVVLFVGVFTAGTPIVFTRECVLFGLFVVWIASSLFFVPRPEVTQLSLITLVKLLGMAVIVLHAINGRSSYLWLLWAIVLVAIVASLGGWSGLARGAETVMVGSRSHSRAMGTFGNPNGLSKLACLATWAAIAIFFSTRKPAIKGSMVACCVFYLIVIGATGSRQAIVGYFLIMVVTYWFMIRKLSLNMSRKMLWLAALCLVMVAAVAYLGTTAYWYRMALLIESVGGGEITEGSARGRLGLLRLSMQAAWENPIFGLGYGNLRYWIGGFTSSRLGYRSAHNSIVGIAGETGFIGWSLFFGAWFLLLLRIRKADRLPLPRSERALLLSSWLLHVLMGLWSLMAQLELYKPFWALLAANLGYVVWLERTYGQAGVDSHASGDASGPEAVYPGQIHRWQESG